MKEKAGTMSKAFYKWLGSTSFFILSLSLFFINALWVALSSNLLPYDEYYHVGIIKFYSLQWSPFISFQPAEMSVYGDITRLSSYVYHYAMSFPYRFFDVFINDEIIIIILLRIINIALVVVGVILFRNLFLKVRLSRRLVNVVIALFLATPIIAVLAAQNNYDNLMFLLTPLFLGSAYKLITSSPRVYDVLQLLSLGMIATLVKFNFIVVFVSVSFYVVLSLLLIHKKKLPRKFTQSLRPCGVLGVFTIVMFILSLGFFTERVGFNIIKYREVKVDCASVQSVEVCSNYSPWRRNQAALANKPQTPLYGGVAEFSSLWFSRIMRGFFAIFANIIPSNLNQPDPYGHYVFRPLLPLPIAAAYGLLGVSLVAFILYARTLLKSKFVQLSLVAALSIIISLWIFNYLFYIKYGRAYAIQARYIVPVLMPMLVVLAEALRLFSAGSKQVWIRLALFIVALIFIFSGGVLGWIIRSDSSWYWPNETVVTINQSAQMVLKKVIPH